MSSRFRYLGWTSGGDKRFSDVTAGILGADGARGVCRGRVDSNFTGVLSFRHIIH